MKVDDVYYIKGIVSASYMNVKGCNVNKNAVYTELLKHRPCIDQIMNSGVVEVITEIQELPNQLEDIQTTTTAVKKKKTSSKFKGVS